MISETDHSSRMFDCYKEYVYSSYIQTATYPLNRSICNFLLENLTDICWQFPVVIKMENVIGQLLEDPRVCVCVSATTWVYSLNIYWSQKYTKRAHIMCYVLNGFERVSTKGSIQIESLCFMYVSKIC
jgi:hypothetical protein